MEDAEQHRALEHGDEPRSHDRGGVDAGCVHPGHVVEREPIEPFHHEHAPGHERGMRPGDDERALVRCRQHPRDVEHVLCLEAEVELLDDGLGEQLDERRWVGERADRDAPHEQRREPCHRGQVAAHETFDRWPLHLDDDVLAGPERGRVHLRDRRGCERRLVDVSEHRLERLAQLRFDDAVDVDPSLRRHLVA